MTWLYSVRTPRPELIWGPCVGKERMDEGFHNRQERLAARAAGVTPPKRLSANERIHTPPQLRDILVNMARETKEN